MAVNDHGFSIEYIVGAGGAGKTMGTVRYYARQRLMDPTRRLTCNLPLNDKFFEYVAARSGQTVDQVRDRVTLLDDRTLDRWRHGEGGPWELSDTDGGELMGDLVIDEVHAFCPKYKCPNLDRWEDFLGQGRHYGWDRMRFLTQASGKVNATIEMHAHVKYSLVRGDSGRIRWIQVPWADWYQLLASFTGQYMPLTWRVEYGRDAKGDWKEQNRDAVTIDKQIGSLYSTRTSGGGGMDGKGLERPMDWQWRPRLLPWKVQQPETPQKEWTAPTWLWVASRVGWRWLYVGPIVWALFMIASGNLNAVVDVVKMPAEQLQHNMTSAVAQTAQKQRGSKDAKPKAKARSQAAPSVPRSAARVPDPTTPDGAEFDSLRLVENLLDALEDNLPRLREGGSLSCVGESFVAFRDGSSYRVGEVIEHGPFQGRTVAAIDHGRRSCRLDDGRLLWLSQTAGGDDEDTELSDLVQAARDHLGAHGRSRDNGERSVLVTERSRNAALGIRRDDGEEGRRIDRNGGGFGRQARHYRRAEPTRR